MLQIRLNNRTSSDGGGGAKALPVETVTVACPDHLILADLPVAKSIGNASTTTTHTKTIGRRSRRHLGERVHFCVRCDFPIAIYGRLSPCEHAFCLDCARSDSSCYLCDERIQKIQTIKMMEGIFICAAPHCLKSFLKKSEFEFHIHDNHADLLQPNTDKEDCNELDAFNVTRGSSTDLQSKQSVPMEISTARSLPRAGFSPSSNAQAYDSEDRARRQQPREQPPLKPLMQPKPPPYFGRHQNPPSELYPENNPPQGFDRPGPYNHFHSQQGFDMQGGPDFSMHSQQPPTFVVPVNANQGMPPTFSYPPFPAEGAQPFFNARTDMTSEAGPGQQGSLLGFAPHPAGSMGFPDNYPRPWNVGHPGAPFNQMPVNQGVSEGYPNAMDSQGRVQFPQGDYGRMPGGLPSNPPPLLPPPGNQGSEPHQSGSASDNKDGKGVLAPLPLPPPPPPQLQRGNFSNSGDTGREG